MHPPNRPPSPIVPPRTPSWARVPPWAATSILHVGLELCDPDPVRDWLSVMGPEGCVVACAVELSISPRAKDLLAALAEGRTRWVDVDLAVLRLPPWRS